MLPEDPTRSGASGRTTYAKIIPLRRRRDEQDEQFDLTTTRTRAVTQPQGVPGLTRRPRGTREDAVRHYLKFMLPFIPITAFIITFLYGYVLVGMHTVAVNGRAAASNYTPSFDPTLPLIGALLVAITTGALCLCIYWGHLHIAERRS
jgi:hypothetical protein